MTYSGIFPSSAEVPEVLYPILSTILCLLLYFSLFSHSLQKIIEQLYYTAAHFDHTERSVIYFFLVNFPSLVLGISSIVHNRSLTGLQICFNIDELQIFLVSAYICNLQESRQTPIRGFLFIRDIIILLSCYGCLIKIYYDGTFALEYGLILLGIYFIYYIMQLLQAKMQQSVLQLVGLKESKAFNSQFLLSQQRLEGNYLQIKEIIQENADQISIQIQEAKTIISKIEGDMQYQQIMMNLAKLIIPYKKAFQIKLQKEAQINQQQIQQEWENGSNQSQLDEENYLMQEASNNSGAQLRNMNTYTEEDYIDEDQQYQQQQQSTLNCIIKYACYPIYLFSFAQGRLHYLVSYIAFFLLVGCLWLLSNSSYYFTYQSKGIGFSIITLIIALLLVYPPSKYFIKISAFHDYDFLNIFIQGAILKSVIFGMVITIAFLVQGKESMQGSTGYIMLMVFRILTYITFSIFMITNKFATHNDNIYFLIAMTVCTQVLRIIVQTTIQTVI